MTHKTIQDRRFQVEEVGRCEREPEASNLRNKGEGEPVDLLHLGGDWSDITVMAAPYTQV